MKLRWNLKQGDLVYYKTKRGNEREFIYGRQTWYGQDLPKRIKSYWRRTGKRWYRFRLPTIGEILARTMRSYGKQLKEAILAPNPFLVLLRDRGVKPIELGPTISEPIKYK